MTVLNRSMTAASLALVIGAMAWIMSHSWFGEEISQPPKATIQIDTRGSAVALPPSADTMPAAMATVDDAWIGEWNDAKGSSMKVTPDSDKGAGHYHVTMQTAAQSIATVFPAHKNGAALIIDQGKWSLALTPRDDAANAGGEEGRACLAAETGEVFCPSL